MTRITIALLSTILMLPSSAGAQEPASGPPPVRATFAVIDGDGIDLGQGLALGEEISRSVGQCEGPGHGVGRLVDGGVWHWFELQYRWCPLELNECW